MLNTLDSYYSSDRRAGGRRGNRNIDVYKDTQKLFTTGIYNHVKPMDSIVMWKDKEVPLDPQFDTVLEVENTDTLTMAEQYISEGLYPLVLNMASAYNPGGGVAKGSRAQEEDLFRRSNYFMTLDKRKLPKNTYPIKGINCIYSPNVCVVKDTNYELLSNPFYATFLAVPAIKNPELNDAGTGYARKVDYDLTKDKIEMCYKVAIQQGHDSLVLGALGCGAYYNPTRKVANIFKQMNQKYNGCFKKIGFPVLSSENNPNFDIFNEILFK